MKSHICISMMLAFAAITGCSGGSDKAGNLTNFGVVSLKGQVAPGNAFTLTSVDYSISGPSQYTGSLVSPAKSTTISSRIGNIVPGTYSMTLTGHTNEDASITCSGTAAQVAVQAGKAVFANVSMVCQGPSPAADAGMVDIVATASMAPSGCPVFLNDSASALEIPADGTTSITLTATGSSTTPVATLSWNAPSGIITPPTGASVTYTCAPSRTTIVVPVTLTISNGANDCSPINDVINITCPGVAPFTDVPIAVTTGDHHACAITTNGDVYCWGQNLNGQLGAAPTGLICLYADCILSPVRVQGLAPATAVIAGSLQTCALLSDRSVACWGWSGYGQGGPSNGEPSYVPKPIPDLIPVATLAAEANDDCVILADGTLYCWGYNGDGELGGMTTQLNGTIAPLDTTPVHAVAVGPFHVCAAPTDGTVDCWGWNQNGQLGYDTGGEPSLTPRQVPGISNAIALGAGVEYSCALLSDRTIECWGGNYYGQLGNGTTTDSLTPVKVEGLTDVTAFDAGIYAACAVRSDGKVYCWGHLLDDTSKPLPVPEITAATSVSVGNGFACVVENHEIKCWGSNSFGEFGNGTTTSSDVPTNVRFP